MPDRNTSNTSLVQSKYGNSVHSTSFPIKNPNLRKIIFGFSRSGPNFIELLKNPFYILVFFLFVLRTKQYEERSAAQKTFFTFMKDVNNWIGGQERRVGQMSKVARDIPLLQSQIQEVTVCLFSQIPTSFPVAPFFFLSEIALLNRNSLEVSKYIGYLVGPVLSILCYETMPQVLE